MNRYPAYFDRFTICLTRDEAETGGHQGQCAQDIEGLLKTRAVAKELDTLNPCDIVLELKDFGAWDEEELKDHDANVARILWIACGDLCEQKPWEEE